MANEVYDIVIIGSGIVGYGTAVYAGRFNMKALVVGETPGGVITTTDLVENYPGYKKLSGFELSEKVREHAAEYNTTFANDRVTEVKKENKLFTIKTLSGEEFTGKTVVFATGTEWKKLNAPGEKEYANKGVHYCALCDGAFYRNKIGVVIGGADSAAKDALVLAQFCSKVYMIVRGDKIRAEPVNYDRLLANKKIEILYKTNVKEIKGEKFVKSVILDKEYNGSNELKVDGIFVAIGHLPLSQLATSIGVAVDNHGEIIVDTEAKTNVEGVFAAGDVTNLKFKQAITGVAQGVNAAVSAYEFNDKNK